MVDIHTHILPNIDDGSESLEDTLEMLKLAEKDGIKKIVATPHYLWGRYENEYVNICSLVKRIKEEADRNEIEIDIVPGQEVFIDKHILQLYRQGIIRGINDTNYILVEFPMNYFDVKVLEEIYELRLLGLKPIVAHPERYSFLMEDIVKINDFIDEGCLFQINAGSIIGLFGKEIKKTAEELIKLGICDFIASDVHSRRRIVDINHALSVAVKMNKSLENSVKSNGERVINGEEIQERTLKVTRKKTFFDFIKKTF